MTNSKNTKKALLASVVALLMCCSMLIGTTFAWFTDSVSSVNNVITAGNLDVEVTQNGTDIREIELFKDILWEPGVVAYETLTVENVGTLALRYSLNINFANQNTVNENGKGLAQVLKYAIVTDDIDPTDRNGLVAEISAEDGWSLLENAMAPGNVEPTVDNFYECKNGVLYAQNDIPAVDGAATTKTFHIVIWWEPSSDDNDWNVNNDKTTSDGLDYLHIDLGVNVFATQYTYEEDSFGNDYDAQAPVATGAGSGVLEVGDVAVPVEVRNGYGSKIGAVVVMAESLADADERVTVHYTKVEANGNITIDDGMETLSYDITVTNLKEGNDVAVKTYIRLPEGLDPTTVTVYHYDEQVNATYDPNSGYVIFYTTSFSPFTVVYDAESEYVAGDANESNLPVASVERATQYENTELPWGSYGSWSPSEGLDSQLEAAYIFSCVDTPEQAEASPYAYWYCDFYVMLNCDLGENELFLGGNYGEFGWVGFHNGDVTLDANTEIGLLESVTTNPWTYADVANYVGTFICGVGDVDDALSGATFTVMLRLTNPDDATEFYNVATINFTFE